MSTLSPGERSANHSNCLAKDGNKGNLVLEFHCVTLDTKYDQSMGSFRLSPYCTCIISQTGDTPHQMPSIQKVIC